MIKFNTFALFCHRDDAMANVLQKDFDDNFEMQQKIAPLINVGVSPIGRCIKVLDTFELEKMVAGGEPDATDDGVGAKATEEKDAPSSPKPSQPKRRSPRNSPRKPETNPAPEKGKAPEKEKAPADPPSKKGADKKVEKKKEEEGEKEKEKKNEEEEQKEEEKEKEGAEEEDHATGEHTKNVFFLYFFGRFGRAQHRI